MKKTALDWVLFLAVGLALLAVPFAMEARTIKIGVIGPMNFVQGKGHWNGATMAAEEINAKGGVQWARKK